MSIACIVSFTPKHTLPVSCEISSKYPLISFFSWMNLTLPSVSAASSIAWLKPFSPPYDTSTILITFCCNRRSNMSDRLSSVLKSAEPARMSPATLHLSLVMNIRTASSATLRT